MCFASQPLALFRHRNFQKWCALYILTWKCASRHNGVHFFDSSTSKSGQKLKCFLHFDLETCFAPRRAPFSTSQLPKVVRKWCALYILTWKCASSHNGVHFFDVATSKSGPELVRFIRKCASHHFGVQFFISHLARWLCTRRFSEPTFRPPRASNHWKNMVSRVFPTFSCTCIFFLLSLALLCSSWLLLSDSSHLCFCICPYCRKFDF